MLDTPPFLRSLQQQGYADQDNYYEYNLAEYSLRFDKCQYVKMYDEEIAQDEDIEGVLAIKHFAVFSLCPSDTCESSSCDANFGQYVAELEEYLELTVQEQEQAFEEMCDNCNERCNDEGDYCSGCGKLCYRYENLNDEGFIDAAEYIECQALEMDADDDGSQLYIGPRCSADGTRVLIGLFSDEDCLDPHVDEDPEDYLGAKLSYHLLSHTSSETTSICLSCKEQEEDGDANDDAANNDNNDNNNNDQEDLDDVAEMCENIYNVAAKCESKNGLTGGFMQMKKEDNDYENQVETEFMSCSFIESLLSNSYTETGDINLEGGNQVVFRSVTETQQSFMGILLVSIVGLLAVVIWLQNKLDKRQDERIDLSAQTAGVLS